MSTIEMNSGVLSNAEVNKIHHQERMSLLRLAFFLTVFFGFSGMGIIGVGTSAIGIDLPSGSLPVLAFVFGAAAVVGCYYSTRRIRADLRLDLANQVCEEWHIFPDEIVEAVPAGSWPCLLVACGSETIVLAGGWWEFGQGGRSEIEWTGRGKKHFPTDQFIVRRLPKSGRILSVVVKGKKIRIKNRDSGHTPLLSVDHPGYVDCRLYHQPIIEMLTPAPE
jgi:hypothetical protein